MRDDIMDSFTFEDHGRDFEAEIFRDNFGSTPWENEDGHGPVSEWRNSGYAEYPKKAPGERVLVRESGGFRTYHMQAATKKAWAEGWGMGEKEIEALSAKLKRPATKGDIIHEAVERDFQRMRGWCNDDWCWVTVHVTDLASGDDDYLGGVESDGNYWREIAREMAEGLHPLAEAHEAANLEVCSD